MKAQCKNMFSILIFLIPFLSPPIFCLSFCKSASAVREREGRGGEGRKEKKSGCFISIDTIMMTVCRNSNFLNRAPCTFDPAVVLWLFSLFSFFINGVAPLSLNVQQVDLLAPWGGFCFFPPLGGCLWMKTGTEEEEDKRERGRRGRAWC